MTVDEFSRSVHMGVELSKRISYGKNTVSMSAPKTPSMKKSLSSTSSSMSLPESYIPTAPMVYAVIVDPSVVDNPDICSYQPYVYGHCDPPALVPLHMHGITMEVDCYLDTAFVTLTGIWRVHCVASSACCDCRIAIPLGEQGSVLGIEVETTNRSFSTQFVTSQNVKDVENTNNDGILMKNNTYMFKISQVDGGSYIHAKIKWSQKLLYQDHEFCFAAPFTFPAHVVPVVKANPMKEKVLLNVNSGTDTDVICNVSSHPLKETRRQAGELGFLYEADVTKWSSQDFCFSYSVCKDDAFASLILQTPSLNDFDQRDMFCIYLSPGKDKSIKAFKKEVVFLVDISGSMQNDPLEKSKDAVLGYLSELNYEDSFNIIAFNGDIHSFSPSLESATDESIANATEWMNTRLIAQGGTNFLDPLKQAFDMVGKTSEAIPIVFLITDGTVEDERDICNTLKDRLIDGGINCPRICTFGIGSYCNHYFLQMLAHMGRGCYDAAYDLDSISDRLPRLLRNASSTVLANVNIDTLDNLDSLELYPFRIPDLCGTPLIVSGRYKGSFPNIVKASGFTADMTTFTIDIKVKNAKGIPLDKVCARREIDMLTARAWLEKSTELEEKITKMSLQMGVPSEYNRMILVQSDKVKTTVDSVQSEEKCLKLENRKMIYLKNISVGFGNLLATIDNLPPGLEELKLNEPAGMMMKAASSCWGMFLDRCCCMGFLQSCSQMNDQCAIALTQLCTALACFECLNCCCEICDSCSDLC